MNVYQALNAVMKDVLAVGKDGRNSQGGYMFRGIDAVVNAVGPALRKHSVIVAPRVQDYQYGTVVVGKNRTEMSHARLLIEFTFYGPDGDSLTTCAAGEAMDSGDKATAKAHSVAFRTALLQTLCLPTDEPDPDEHTYERSAPDLLAQAKSRVWKIAQRNGWNRAQLADDFAGWSPEGALADADADTLTAYADALEAGGQ